MMSSFFLEPIEEYYEESNKYVNFKCVKTINDVDVIVYGCIEFIKITLFHKLYSEIPIYTLTNQTPYIMFELIYSKYATTFTVQSLMYNNITKEKSHYHEMYKKEFKEFTDEQYLIVAKMYYTLQEVLQSINNVYYKLNISPMLKIPEMR